MLPDYAEKKDAAITKSFMPRYRANSLSMGFGSVSPPKAQLEEEAAGPKKGRSKKSVLGKLTQAKKSALRLFHGGQSPKKPSEEPPGKSPKKSPKKSSPKKKKKEEITPSSNLQDQMDMSDFHLHPNAMRSTRSLWGHFGRGSNVNLAAKAGDAAQSAPAGPAKQKSPKKPKHKASAIYLETAAAKSPRKLKDRKSVV